MATDEEIAHVADVLEESCRRNRTISQSTKDYWRAVARDALERLEIIKKQGRA